MEKAHIACSKDPECMEFISDEAKILNDWYNYYGNDSSLDAATIYAE